jgi:hypothetical protein
MASPPWLPPRSGQLRPPPATPPASLKPPRDDLSVDPRGFGDPFLLLLQIATLLDLEENRLQRLVVSDELWSSSSTLACSWD